MTGNEHSSQKTILAFAVFLILVDLAWAADTPQASQSLPPQVGISSDSRKDKTSDNAQVKNPLDVFVIASRLPSFEESLNDMPMNITYKDRKDLNEIRPLTFQDAVRDSESVILYDSVGNGLDTTFGLRGFASSSSVIFLVDGVRVNEIDDNAVIYPLLRMQDVRSVQIDRGSASSVYGANAFGGVVHITTGQASAKPVSLFGGLEWTSFHGLHFNQGFSGTLEDRLTPLGGKWTYYFNGERDNDHGFRNNDDWRLTSFDVKTAYELPEGQGKVHFGLKHIDDAVSMPGEVTFQQFQDDPWRTNKPLDGRKFKNTILQIGADKKFWDERLLASVLASERWNDRKAFTTTGTFVPFYAPTQNPYTAFVNINNRERDLTWELKYEDSWRWLANESRLGMEYRDGRNLATQRDAFGGNIALDAATRSDRTAQPANVSLFWRETLKFWDRIMPYFGMRHDFHWLNTQDALDPKKNLSNRWRKSTLSTGVTVRPVKWMDWFANYSQGFRVPTIDEMAPYASTELTPLHPEKTDSYETGMRLRFRHLAEFKSSYFLIDLQDEITYDSTAVSATNLFGRNINIAKSRRYGIENRINFNPVKEVNLYSAYTWMRAYVRETDGAERIKDGRSLGLVPENRFAAGATVSPLARLGETYGGLRLGLYGTFTGRQHPSSYESLSQTVLNATGGAGHTIKPYSVWDFVLSYTWRGKEIYFKINNIFDEKYYSRAINQSSYGTSIYPGDPIFGTPYTFVNPGAPREFVLGSKWEF